MALLHYYLIILNYKCLPLSKPVKINFKKVKHNGFSTQSMHFLKNTKQLANQYLSTRDYSCNYHFPGQILLLQLKTDSMSGSPLLNNWLLTKYISQVTSSYTGFKTSWVFVDVQSTFTDNYFYIWWYKLYNKRVLKSLFTTKITFFNWFVQLCNFKDPRGLVPFLQKQFNKVHLKRHRKIFYSISNFLRIWYIILLKKNKIKGYSLFFKGKLAREGSVRKKTFFSKRGLTSLTNKQLRVNYRTYNIWTVTGTVGAGISIFY